MHAPQCPGIASGALLYLRALGMVLAAYNGRRQTACTPMKGNEMKREDKIEILKEAIDQLKQYADYSEAMSKHGQGFTPSSRFSTSHMLKLLQAIIDQEKDDTKKGIQGFIEDLKTNLEE